MTDSKHHSDASRPYVIVASRLLSGAPQSVWEGLLNAAKPISLVHHGRLFEQGDAGEVMYLVKSGRIEISIMSETGRKIVLNHIPEGHVFGEISMIDGQSRTASAVALSPTVVVPITRQSFLNAARDCPQLVINLAEILCERLRWVSGSVEEFALMSLDLRLARKLLTLHAKFGDTDDGIALTQSDLADHVGATRESTNKTLMRWKDDGFISMTRGKIQILDMNMLAHIAHGDSADYR